MASVGVALENSRAWNGSGASSDQSIKLYKDNYMRWNKLLDKASKHRVDGMSLQGRIEAIFGVPVVS